MAVNRRMLGSAPVARAARSRARPKQGRFRLSVLAAELLDDRAIGAVVAAALLDQIRERVADRSQLTDLSLHPRQMLRGHRLDVVARPRVIAVEGDQALQVLDR